jgi:transcriptional regulator with GAF, ATPase, and Fis domain
LSASAAKRKVAAIEDPAAEPVRLKAEKIDACHCYRDIIGQSASMQQVFALVEKVAGSGSTVLIRGETGTGKGMLARALHDRSDRKGHPFVAINCGAIPENLLESELFGHVRGAFTGATSNKPGKFERADGGTVFLDEIGDMSLDLQVKLLKVLEEGEIEPVGGTRTVKVDLRVIAATHRDLDAEVQKGRFREDLFYRLYVIPVCLPPLRRRRSDIPLLAAHFMHQSNLKNHCAIEGMLAPAVGRMKNYPWPGNVRELKNIIERIVILKGSGCIAENDLPMKIKQDRCPFADPRVEFGDEGICLNTAVTEFEKRLIAQTLEKTRWVKNQAAKLLQLNRTTLVEKIKRHGLQPPNSADYVSPSLPIPGLRAHGRQRDDGRL